MLFEKYRNNRISHVTSYINRIYIKNKCMRSLQAQMKAWQQKRRGALRFASCEGSVTVETVLVLPVFLSAICGLLMMGNLLLTEANIQYALARTADIYAAQKAVKSVQAMQQNNDAEKTGKEIGTMANTLLQAANIQVIFSSVYDSSSANAISIVGGRAGIMVSASVDEEQEIVKVAASYRLKIEIPFINSVSFFRKISARQRIYSGYVEHGGEKETKDSDIVYVAENGSVYHTSLSCTHICLHIAGSGVENVLAQKKLQPCDKCIEEGEALSSLYITKYGDKYHSTMHCSGLKRTVRAITKEEAKGMKLCSRCAARQ